MITLTEDDIRLARSTAERLVDNVRRLDPSIHQDLSSFGKGPKIISNPKNEQWGDYEHIGASFNAANGDIRVRIPNRGYYNTGGADPSNVANYVATVVIHEWVHHLQNLADPNAFAEEVKKQSIIQKEIDRSGGTPESFYPYYTMDFEVEAHSAQICIEMKLSELEFLSTKTWKRIEGRLCDIAGLEDLKKRYEIKTSEFYEQLFGMPRRAE